MSSFWPVVLHFAEASLDIVFFATNCPTRTEQTPLDVTPIPKCYNCGDGHATKSPNCPLH